jgi:cytochrome c-type biogenesis protein CcmH
MKTPMNENSSANESREGASCYRGVLRPFWRRMRYRMILIPALILTVSAFAQETRVPDAQQVVGGPRGTPLTGMQLDRRAAEVAALLRCPVCQGLSVADSPSVMAQDMKGQVRDLLGRGYDEEQILKYFETSYGQFVRLEPKKSGVNWLVWLAPVGALLFGAGVIYATLRRKARLPVTVLPVAAADDPELAPYLTRVRELAYGKQETE